jgi:diguanylate cyclase (GGDEF)-like protein
MQRMSGAERRASWQGDRLRGAPKSLVLLLLTAESTAVVLGVAALLFEHTTLHSWGRALLLLCMGVAFERISHEVGKLRLLLRSGPKPDMTSVWTFAAALALYPGQAALLAVGVIGQAWLMRQRSPSHYLYRRIYTAATIVLACLAASAVVHDRRWPVGALPDGLRPALTLLLALLIYTCINRVLISIALVCAGAPVKANALIGGWDDNALEIATLCLGYFTALSVIHQPWLTPLMLMPTLLLQRGALVKELEHAAATDTKTQLLTALAWQNSADLALQRALRDSTPIAVLLIDLDHFKRLNDSHGHLIGDAALLSVADQLRRELRKSDVVGRFGGEEFVVLLPGLDLAHAFDVADRIRIRIAGVHVSALGVSGAHDDSSANRLSASIGLAHFPGHGQDLSELLHAADAALYQAKHNGRNRVEVAWAPGAEGYASVFGPNSS